MRMSRSEFGSAVLATAAVALFTLGLFPAHADMMAACETDIATHCADVRNGRGRISACLFANTEKLSAACAPEVAEVSNSRQVQKFIPSSVSDLQGTPYETELRRDCTSDANRLCSGVVLGEGRMLACLYSRSSSLSGSCEATAERVLKKLR